MEEIKIKKNILILSLVAFIFAGVLVFVIWDLRSNDSKEDLQDQISEEVDSSKLQGDAEKLNERSQNETSKKRTNLLSVEAFTKKNLGSAIIGIPTENSITVNIIASDGMEAFVEYGVGEGMYSQATETFTSDGDPIEIEIDGLDSNSEYSYRVKYREDGDFISGDAYSFHTARPKGSTFTFGIQGDSHPEREGIMFNGELYTQTMNNVLKDNPDFYFTIGDDFSLSHLVERDTLSQELVDQIYLRQRGFLGLIGSSASLFLVNGNHEQAARYWLDGTSDNVAVLAAKSRMKNYPLPVSDGFYSGDVEEIENVGLVRDYYSFEWGDALFVTLDPYWHTDVDVDNVDGNGMQIKGDLWDNTIGDEQYSWFKETLEESDAKYKFVFAHHVLGTSRGGIENARLYEWGGYNRKGVWEFDTKRPGWEMPIHQLMVENDVSIFFQGHDHLFAHQELDGVVYQSLSNPADDTYTAFNEEAYKSGDVLPNSGYVRVAVSPEVVNVDYVRSFLSGDGINGEVAYSYGV
jgi:hypothetical protein